jgi:putative transposase
MEISDRLDLIHQSADQMQGELAMCREKRITEILTRVETTPMALDEHDRFLVRSVTTRAMGKQMGLQVSDSTVRRYRPKPPRSSSQSWKTFLRTHTKQIAATDFFAVPTATYRVLFVFIVLVHERRKVVHFAITEAPSAFWTGQQFVNAFPFETAPRFLLRDRDGIYGSEFVRRAASLGVEEKMIAPRSPWQNPCVERLIGSLRRECLDHVIILNERHLHRVIREYLDYYHRYRTHRALKRDCPVPRPVEEADRGKVIELSMVGGLHHRYTRRAT